MLCYGWAHLTWQDLSFMEILPTTVCIHIDGMKDIRICHNTQKAVNEKMRSPNSENQEILAGVGEEYMLYGHTHRIMSIQVYSETIWNRIQETGGCSWLEVPETYWKWVFGKIEARCPFIVKG